MYCTRCRNQRNDDGDPGVTLRPSQVISPLITLPLEGE